MRPKNADEMTTILINLVIARSYLEITAEARRKRLTEHDIAIIEQRVVRELDETAGIEHEFKTFDVEPAIAKAKQLLQDMFAGQRSERQKRVGKP